MHGCLMNMGICYMELAIYGAQGIALDTYEAIHNLYPVRTIRCFLVTEYGQNPECLAGIPVLELKSFAEGLSQDEKDGIEILIATPENFMGDIEKSLDAYGIHCHVRLTSACYSELMGFYFACQREYLPLSALPVGYHRPEIHMFVAKCHKDAPLKMKYAMPEWVVPIQVGAALCKERVADVLDCGGDNISGKNANYSELTALYWIWKNRMQARPADGKEEYFGLSHYRRILELSEDDVARLSDNDVDVVLPFPMAYEPDMEAHHRRYLADGDWTALLAALEELQPEYAGQFPEILGQKYLYNYNIMLARAGVLADYCGWLFPILERVEALSVPRGSDRSDRYIGYMGESLATLYFMANKDKLNILHAGCRFMT